MELRGGLQLSLVVFVAALVLSVPAKASVLTCSNSGSPITLDVANADNSGLNNGNGGCETANIFFSNFLVTSSGAGNAPTGAPGVQILGTSDNNTDPSAVTATFTPSASSGQFSWNEAGVSGGSSITTSIDFLVSIDPSVMFNGSSFLMLSQNSALGVTGLSPGDSIALQTTVCPGLTSTPCNNSYSGQVGSTTITADSTNPSGVSTGPVDFSTPATVVAVHTLITINLAADNPGDPSIESFSTTLAEVSAVPEPSTLILSAAAMAGLALRLRRHRVSS